MADVAGLVVGTVALASLFTTCVEVFEVIDLASDHSRDLEIIATGFEAQRVRLIVWGQIFGLQSSIDRVLEQEEVRSVIWRSLCCIKMLFEDGTQLSTKYGLRPTSSSVLDRRSIFRETYRRFRERIQERQHQASLLTVTKWAIRDRLKFKDLVQDLKGLIDDLESITTSASMLQLQRELTEMEIASISDETSLRLVEAATLSSAAAISSAASQRRLRIQETSTIDSSEHQSFVTAESRSIQHSSKVALESDSNNHQEDLDVVTLSQNARVGQALSLLNTISAQPVCTERQLSVVQQPRRPVRIAKDKIDEIYALCQSRATVRRRMIELMSLVTDQDKHGWRVGLSDFDFEHGEAICYFPGPVDGPYAGGIFYLRFRYPEEYPFTPPICQLLTKIYHPNIDAFGRICVDILYDQWRPSFTLETALVSVASMLDTPNVEDPLVLEIAEQYLRNKDRYFEIAKDYTARYATGELRVSPYTGPDGRSWWVSAQILPPPSNGDHAGSRLRELMGLRLLTPEFDDIIDWL